MFRSHISPLARLVVLSVISFGTVLAGPSPAQESITLKLADTLNLKDVFDVGLRPRLISGLERSDCELSQQKLEIICSETLRIPIDVETARFTINRDDRVVQFLAYSHYLTLTEAAEIMLPILQATGTPIDAFQAFILSVEKEFSKAYEGFGIRIVPSDIIQIGLGFGVGVERLGKPLRFQFTAQWKVPNSRYDQRTTDIKAPAGYEDVSMAPWVPPGRRRALELQAQEESEKQRQEEDTSRGGAAPVGTAPLQPAVLPRPWVWVAFLSLLLLAGLAYAVARHRRTA